MKKTMLIVYLSFSGLHFGQNKIELCSIVLDRITRRPISYANVGFISRGTGTVTNEQGYFKLPFLDKHILDKDTLQITAQGYYPLRVTFSESKSILDKTKILYLSKLPKNNESLKISSYEKLYPREIGLNFFSDATIGWSKQEMKGYEFASLVKLSPGIRYLRQLRFNISEHKADSTKIRVNFYNVRDDLTPGEKVFTSIYHTIKINRGEEIINLYSQRNFCKKHIIVGLELLDHFDSSDHEFKVKMFKNLGTSYIKNKSQDDWQVLPYNSVGFSLTVLDLKNDIELFNKETEKSKIRGKVLANKKPIQGCEVSIRGKLNYVQTSSDGSFIIDADIGDILNFRSLAFKSKDLLIEDYQPLTIFLEPKYELLSDVTIKSNAKNNAHNEITNTPFGYKKKISLGYSSVSKNRDQLNKAVTGVKDLIIGRFPVERGSSSFSLSNSRKYIVDGVPFNGDINLLDPNNVSNVTVINGLAGTIRYGTYGRNGVTLITTKISANNKEFLQSSRERNSILIDNNDYKIFPKPYDTILDFKTEASKLQLAKSFETAKTVFSKNLEANIYDINFYIESFKYFMFRDKQYAYKILEMAEKVANNNPKALRGLAYFYDSKNKFKKAHEIYKRIGELEPQRAQSYLDLAQSFVSVKDYSKAFSLYKLILNNRIPGVIFSSEILQIAITEIKHLVTRNKNAVDYRDLHPSFYNKAQILNGRILLEWNDPLSEFEVQFVNPNKKFFTWNRTSNKELDQLQIDKGQGYNSKEFLIEQNEETGTWLVNVKGFLMEGVKNKIPGLIKCTIYKNYGSPEESKQVKLIELHKVSKYNTAIAKLNL